MRANFSDMRLISKPCMWFLGCAAMAALAMPHRAMAGNQFMNINFDGDMAGSAPATNASVTLPITQPYSIGGYDDSSGDYGDTPPKADEGTVVVNNAGTMSKAAVFSTFNPNDQEGALWMDTEYSVVSNSLLLSFDIDIQQTVASSTIQTYNLNSPTGPTIGMIFGLNQFTAAGSILGFAAAPTSTSAGVFGLRNPNLTELDSFFNYTVGQTYQIDLYADYSTDTVDAYVNGVLEMSDYPMRAGFTSNDLTETFAFVNGDTDGSNVVALDNLTATVPEPASLGFLSIAGLAMVRRRCRS